MDYFLINHLLFYINKIIKFQFIVNDLNIKMIYTFEHLKRRLNPDIF